MARSRSTVASTSLVRATFHNRVTQVSGVVLLCIVFVAIFGNLLLPVSAYSLSAHLLAPPSTQHLLGTDELGRDTLARIMLGTRTSLIGAVEAVAIGAVVGVVPGLFSVFLDRWSRFAVLRVADTFMTLPAIVFTIGVIAVFGNTQNVAMAAIGVLFSPHFFRLTRASALGYVHSPYVEAAQLFGMTRWQIIRDHVWRKVLPTVAVTIAQTMASGILIVSSLSFLGVGAQPPMPTWGGMLSEDMAYLAENSYQAIFPGVMIVLTVCALGLIADGLRDATGGLSNLDTSAGSTLVSGTSDEVAIPKRAELVGSDRYEQLASVDAVSS
jgi:peptide/nickel transport system permease protein